MKKLFALLVIAGTIVTLNSCTKEDQDEFTRWLIKTETYNFGTANASTSNYTYDSEGRLTEVIDDDGYRTTVSYSSTTMTVTNYDSTGTNVADTYDYPLNAQGFVTSAFGSDLSFNSDGYLIGSTESNGAMTTNTYVDGNLTESTHTDSAYTSTSTYTYLTDKLELRDRGLKALYGESSKNLVSMINETNSNSSSTYSTNYTYEYDSKGRVTKETRSANGQNQDVTTYTYFE